MLGGILSVIVSGFVMGALARLAVPGPDPMPFWLTVLVGLIGSLVGGGIASAIYGTSHTFDSSGHAFTTLLLEVGAAIVVVAGYRRFVQRRPLSGPDAYRFPARGFGIEQMRSRLRQLGVDPDKLAGRGGGRRRAPETGAPSADEVAESLEELRRLRDSGEIDGEEYERRRELLRRY